MLTSEELGGIAVRSRLKELVLKMEIAQGRRIAQTEIAQATGLDANTISRWMSPKPMQKIESSVIKKLCIWLDCELGDLLYLDRNIAA